VNTVVLRTDVSGDPTFRELVARVREADLAAYDHQDVPFERVVELVGPSRSLGRHPLFQVMLVLQNNTAVDFQLVGLEAEMMDVEFPVAKFDLSLMLGERYRLEELADGDATKTVEGISGVLRYSQDLFDSETAELIVENLVRLLEAVVADA